MDHGNFAALARQFLDRDANDAELIAMSGQAERAARHVAAPSAARGVALFAIEPAHFDKTLQAARHEPE